MAAVAPLKLASGLVTQMVAGTDSILPGMIGTGTANDSVFLRGDGVWASQLNRNGANGATVSMLTLNTGTQNATAVWSANVLTFRNTAGILGHVGMYGDGSVALLGLWAQDGATPTVQVRATGEMRLGNTATSHLRFSTAAYGVGLLAVSGVGDPVTTLYASSAAGSSGLALGFYNGTTFVRRLDIDINGRAVITGTLGVGMTPNVKLSVDGSINIPTNAPLYLNGQTTLGPFIGSGYSGARAIIAAGTDGFQVNNQANNAIQLHLDGIGHVAIGGSPAAWSTAAGSKALQISNGAIVHLTEGAALYTTYNTYYDGASWRSLVNSAASVFATSYTGFIWYTMPATGGVGLPQTITVRMRLTEAGQFTVPGAVGIGGVTPAYQLDVLSGDYRVINISSPNGAGAFIQYTKTTGTARTWILGATGSGTVVGDDKFGLFDVTANLWRWVVDANGNVGIGGVPNFKFQVFNGSESFVVHPAQTVDGAIQTGIRVASKGTHFTLTSDLNGAAGNMFVLAYYYGAVNGWKSALEFSNMAAGAYSPLILQKENGHIFVGSTSLLYNHDVPVYVVFSDADRIFQLAASGGKKAFINICSDVDTGGTDTIGGIVFTRSNGQYDAWKNMSSIQGRTRGPGGTVSTNIDIVIALRDYPLFTFETSSGLFGIGVHPAEKLHIYSAGDTAIRIQSPAAGNAYIVNRTTGIFEFLSTMSGPMQFIVGGTARLQVTHTGLYSDYVTRLAPTDVYQLTSGANWDWAERTYHSYMVSGGSIPSITNAKNGEMKRIDVQGGTAGITISATGFYWAPGHPVWGNRTIVTIIRMDGAPTYIGMTVAVA